MELCFWDPGSRPVAFVVVLCCFVGGEGGEATSIMAMNVSRRLCFRMLIKCAVAALPAPNRTNPGEEVRTRPVEEVFSEQDELLRFCRIDWRSGI